MRCGAPFGDDPSGVGPSRGRSQFAAAPHERLNVPRLVSTLFPHLPRASMVGFRRALAFGVLLVLVLGALRILPVALFAAAVFLPLLTLLYLYDVNVYEDKPLRVVALTTLWGAGAGVGVGLLTRAVTSTGAAFLTQSQSTTVVDQGILLPLLGLALVLAGPLVLLRYPRFNDVLDGATFGTAAAAAFAGAEVITYGFSILSGGLRPPGAILQWLGRLTTIAVTIPVLEMAVVGATAGAFWLRYRAPVRDRGSLGVLSNPFVALTAAAVLVAGAFSLQPLMSTGWWLLCLTGLDLLALLWLRRVIHLGLLEESAELPIGPPITCANCGAQTPRHTFCINCGISLQALPKMRPRSEPSTEAGETGPDGGGSRTWRGGVSANRFGEQRIIVAFTALFLVMTAVAVLIAALGEPVAPKSVCPKHQACAAPPRGGVTPPLDVSLSPRLIFNHEFVSGALGYRFEYPSELVTTDATPTDVTIQPPRSDAALVISFEAAPSSTATPQQMLDRRLASLQARIPDLQADSDGALVILSPALGYRAGVGGFYRGNEDAPSGFTAPADVAILAATDGQETIAVSVTSTNRNHTDELFGYADSILTTLRFRADVPQ